MRLQGGRGASLPGRHEDATPGPARPLTAEQQGTRQSHGRASQDAGIPTFNAALFSHLTG
jgi:hypothetical protein